jgi:leucyl-tRNA synthetase
MCEELWSGVLGESGSVHRQAWPRFDPSALLTDEIEYPVQVNGRVRDRVVVAAEAAEAEIVAAALALPNVLVHTEGKTVRKVVVVPGKLVSVVVS